MKIRASFAILAAAVTAIPVVLLSLGMLAWTLTKSPEPLPAYDQLPRGAVDLTDAKTWGQVRDAVGTRPQGSDTFVFDHNFRLIYGSSRLGPLQSTGDTLTLQDSIRILQGGVIPRDIFLFQPAATGVWIVLVQANAPPAPVAAQKGLFGFIVGLLVVLVAAVALALFMGRALAVSVVGLEKAAQRISQGDLTSPVSAQKGHDEIQSLGRALEVMRQALLEEEARQSRFVMGVSHDLKSPLTLIKGYVELLRDGPVSDPTAREAHFGLILDKVDQLDGMIDHLIDYGKVNTGEWQATWTEVPLGPFLAAFADDLAPGARLLGRTLEAELGSLGDLQVPCDYRSIRRCFENLVHNALRYSDPGGRVGISTARTPGAVEVTVWDDGPGISPQDLPHLFDLFYRGTPSRRESGMGLGLSIVKTILDSHGWTIRAESDHGARFTVTIPVAG